MAMDHSSLLTSQSREFKGNALRNSSRLPGLKTARAVETDGARRLDKPSPPRCAAGFLLMNSSLNPISFNTEAIEILGYPRKLANPARSEVFNTSIRSTLLSRKSLRDVPLVSEFRSGRRRYFCRAFVMDSGSKDPDQASVAVLLERGPSGLIPLSRVSQQFHLTHREEETLRYLLQGLSSKEIANRMDVSSNTVKTFLRLIMIKAGVSSRSAMIGKIFMT
jgi:DNA-binding CsgD family transcriptional regulator